MVGLVGDDLHFHRVGNVFGCDECPRVVGDVGGERLSGEDGFAENPFVGGHDLERESARCGGEASQRDADRTGLVQREAVAVADDFQVVGLFGEGHVAEVVGRSVGRHPARQRGAFGGSDLDGCDRGLFERLETQFQHRSEVAEAQRHGLLLRGGGRSLAYEQRQGRVRACGDVLFGGNRETDDGAVEQSSGVGLVVGIVGEVGAPPGDRLVPADGFGGRCQHAERRGVGERIGDVFDVGRAVDHCRDADLVAGLPTDGCALLDDAAFGLDGVDRRRELHVADHGGLLLRRFIVRAGTQCGQTQAE